jgi:two-component system CheB/CheR fusion protein
MNKAKSAQHKRSKWRRNGANGWRNNGATANNGSANHWDGINSKRLRHIGNLKRSLGSAGETDRKFREMIDALPAAVYTTDAKGRLTNFNQACVELSGRVPELGTDKWCVSWKLFYPDGRRMPHGECPMAIALKTGRVIRGAEAIAERPDGSRIWFTPYPTPLRDTRGRIVGVINMLVDITERREAERQIQESEERLRAIIEQSAIGVARIDLNGKILFANPAFCKIVGYSEEELRKKTVAQLTHPDDRGAAGAVIDRLRNGRTPLE